jgi:hypothetical protein
MPPRTVTRLLTVAVGTEVELTGEKSVAIL